MAGEVREQVEGALCSCPPIELREAARIDTKARLASGAPSRPPALLKASRRLESPCTLRSRQDRGSTVTITSGQVSPDRRTTIVILDFEGEPAKPLGGAGPARPRRLKDVVGMIRSFDYAAFAALFDFAGDRPEVFDGLAPWAKSWRTWASASFLGGVSDARPEGRGLPSPKIPVQCRPVARRAHCSTRPSMSCSTS